MLVVAIMATVALAVDGQPTGNSAIAALIEASGIARFVGLLVGGSRLAFVVVDDRGSKVPRTGNGLL